jgi:serine/threonine protein kinase
MKIEFTEADIGLMFQGLFTGLNYMHSKDIYHRNIKPENIILDKGGNL